MIFVIIEIDTFRRNILDRQDVYYAGETPIGMREEEKMDKIVTTLLILFLLFIIIIGLSALGVA